jgi:uncharacterized protein YeaO (DUF488 family)
MCTIAPYEFVRNSLTKGGPYKVKFHHKYGRNTGSLICLVDVDGMNWETFAPGYIKEIKEKREYKIKRLVGVYEKSNGKHVFIVRLFRKGFDNDDFKNELLSRKFKGKLILL